MPTKKKDSSFYPNDNSNASRKTTENMIKSTKKKGVGESADSARLLSPPIEPKKTNHYHDNDNVHDNYHDNGNDNRVRRGRRPTGRELMTRRVIVLLTPSKYKRLLDIADTRDVSFNELVNNALDAVEA